MQGFGIVEVARSSQILGQVSSKSVWFFALKKEKNNHATNISFEKRISYMDAAENPFARIFWRIEIGADLELRPKRLQIHGQIPPRAMRNSRVLR